MRGQKEEKKEKEKEKKEKKKEVEGSIRRPRGPKYICLLCKRVHRFSVAVQGRFNTN